MGQKSIKVLINKHQKQFQSLSKFLTIYRLTKLDNKFVRTFLHCLNVSLILCGLRYWIVIANSIIVYPLIAARIVVEFKIAEYASIHPVIALKCKNSDQV